MNRQPSILPPATLSLALSFLAAFSLPARADLHWIGDANGGDGTNFFTEANWDADGDAVAPHTTPTGGTIDSIGEINNDLFISSGAIVANGTINLGELGSLTMSSGNLTNFRGIGADGDNGGAQSNLDLSGTAHIIGDYLEDQNASLSGDADLTLDRAGDPLENSLVDIDPAWTGTVHFINELDTDVDTEHLSKFTVGGGASSTGTDLDAVEAGDNLLVASDGGSGAILATVADGGAAVMMQPSFVDFFSNTPRYFVFWQTPALADTTGVTYDVYRDANLLSTGVVHPRNEILSPVGFARNTTFTLRVDTNYPSGVTVTGPDLVFTSRASTLVDTAAHPGAPGDGTSSLGLAVADALPGETLTFDPAVFTGGAANIITLAGTQLTIDKNLTIDASGLAESVTIDAAGNSRVIHIPFGGHTVTLDSLTITGGRTPDGGTFTDGEDGGGISSSGGTLTLNNSTVSGNTTGDGGDGAGGGGGGGGSRGGGGGGIFSVSGTLILNNSTVSGNTTGDGGDGDSGGEGGGGGGINSSGGTLTLNNSTVSGNTTGAGGAGVGVGGGEGGGGGSGGGIFSSGGTLTLNNSTVSGNTTGNGGGGSFGSRGGVGGGIAGGNNLIVLNSTISGNTTGDGFGGRAGGDGGGVAIIGSGTATTLTNVTISNNRTGSPGAVGGGFRNQGSGSTLDLTASIIAGNTASGSDDNPSGSFNDLGGNLISGDPLLAPSAGTAAPSRPTIPAQTPPPSTPPAPPIPAALISADSAAS